jgi:hypothetical protein
MTVRRRKGARDMSNTKGIKRAAVGAIFSAVMALSLLATSGQAYAASVDTRDGGSVTHDTALPTFLITIVVGPFGVSWED